MSKSIAVAQQARELTGTQEGRPTLEALRSGLLIARWNGTRQDSTGRRVYWPKSVYPTVDDASAALKAAGLPSGLGFTQYRSQGGFENLVEVIAAATGGPSKADIDAATEQLSKELNSPEFAAAVADLDTADLDTAPAPKRTRAPKGGISKRTGQPVRQDIAQASKGALRESDFGDEQHAAVERLVEACQVWSQIDSDSTPEQRKSAQDERRDAVVNAYQLQVNLSSIARHTGMAHVAVERMLERAGAR